MTWIDIFLTALGNLWRRKLRTVLTLLGVSIGTTAIAVTISLGIGAETNARLQIESVNDITLIDVYPYYNTNPMGTEDKTESSKIEKITDDVITRIAQIDHVKTASPLYSFWYAGSGQFKIKSGRYESYPNIIGIYPDMLEGLGLKPDEGEFFTQSRDLEFVLSPLAKMSFIDPKRPIDYSSMYFDINDMVESGSEPNYPAIDWLKAKYRLQLETYNPGNGMMEEGTTTTKDFRMKVIGTIKMQKDMAWEFQGATFVNLHALKRFMKANPKVFKDNLTQLEDRGYDTAKVKVDNFDNVEAVTKALKEMGLGYNSPMDMVEASRAQIRNIQTLLLAIGGVSLLVAALSIANTMMMSIYERTREIGVMKVLGCRMGNIRSLFLMEAAFIGLFGGIIGVVMSYSLSYAMNNVAELQDIIGQIMGNNEGSMTSIIPYWLALGAWAFGVVVAVFSGIYPSHRAMKLSPLAAIRNQDS